MKEAVTITVGTVVGVGLFTTGANVVGGLGPAVILATFVAMLISIYPALLYAEMGAALPYAGGTYQYASLGIGTVSYTHLLYENHRKGCRSEGRGHFRT